MPCRWLVCIVASDQAIERAMKEKSTGGTLARRQRLQEVGRVAKAVPRVRIIFEGESKIGPGKIDLLDAIGETGSISAAGRQLGMSYRRAWLLVDAVNKLFLRPVVVASVGGQHGGGAELTDFGRALIAAYRRIEERTRSVIREELSPFESDLAGE